LVSFIETKNFDEARIESMDVAAALWVARALRTAKRLQFYRAADERTTAQRKSPRQMRRAADADAFVCHNIESHAWIGDEAVARIAAQIHLVVSSGDSKRLCEFAGTGAKLTEIMNATASLHQFNPSPWLERANQNEAVRLAFDEHV
jgi:hypothetical protein